MKGPARRLVARLVVIQIVAVGVTGLLVVAFAPRLLLLDPVVVEGSLRLSLVGGAVTLATVLIGTAVIARRLAPLLRDLVSGGENVRPSALQALFGTPARLVAVDLSVTFAVASATLLRPWRPDTNDLHTQAELVLLVMTMASMVVLPAYVTMRASVAGVLETVSVTFAAQGIDLLGTPERRVGPVRQRLLVAVVAPVAFVALGASLLVHAHLRAFDSSAATNGAAELAQGVFDAVEGDVRGRDAAIEVARARGFEVDVSKDDAPFSISTNDKGRTAVTVPLSDGRAILRFDAASLGSWTRLYGALATVAILVAGALGYRIGRAFSDDVALATHELEATGVADVLRGEHIRGDARFASVAALMSAADGLGGVFREFARTQHQAIHASAATERTRGLFLASMSHDLKAPLNAILGFAELVSRGPLAGEQRQSVAIIERRGRELLYLIDTILDVARVEAGELTVSPEPTGAGHVVGEAIHDALLLAERTAEVVGEIQPGVHSLVVDPVRLAQALTAIILVATRLGERGPVIVRAGMAPLGAHFQIDVEVHGRAGPGPDREKVFEAFKHVDRVRRHGSLGLGPFLARAIVELHGGRVAVDTTEGGATVFHVWIPSERVSSRDLSRLI